MIRGTSFRALLAASAAALTLSVTAVGMAYAAGPLVKTQAPGYYRMMVGEIEVTALNDGTIGLPVDQLLTDISPAQVKESLQRSFLAAPVETSVNAFLINTGTKLVLIDTGAAGLFGPTLGKLLTHLQAAGYSPEQVDEIYITHLHPDHVGGLVLAGQRAFPNAIVRADRHDTEFWLSKENMDKAPADGKGFFQGAMASLEPYVSAGRLKPFDGDTELVPGVRAIAAHGHTLGHTVYAIESKGEKLVLWGDLMHVAAVQFAQPSVTVRFDTDPKNAAAERKKAFADAAKQGYWVGAAHLAFPGIGHLRAEGSGYVFVPANYSNPK